jgi:hypothetical protein
MFLRRFVAALLVLGALAGMSVPVSGQGKDKDKDKEKAPVKDKDKKAEEKVSGDKIKFEWKFEPKKSFYQKMVTKTVQVMKVMNNDVNQTQNQTFFFKWTPTKVENDKVTIEQEIIGVIMDIEIGGSKITYDSTKEAPANNPLGDFFKALVGSKFTIELNTKELKVEKMEGREEFLKKLVAANPQMKPLLDTILSQDAIKEMAEPVFAVIPKEPVAVGATWTKTTRLDMGPIGKYENTYSYKFEGPEGNSKDVKRIKVDTKLEYKAPGELVGQGGLPFKIKSAKLESKNPEGVVKFDSKKGRVEETRTKLELKGELAIEIGGQTTKVELSQNQESTVTTSDEDPTKAAAPKGK